VVKNCGPGWLATYRLKLAVREPTSEARESTGNAAGVQFSASARPNLRLVALLESCMPIPAEYELLGSKLTKPTRAHKPKKTMDAYATNGSRGKSHHPPATKAPAPNVRKAIFRGRVR